MVSREKPAVRLPHVVLPMLATSASAFDDERDAAEAAFRKAIEVYHKIAAEASQG